ncbi:alpha-galactosidase [Capsaspora owczarzaki ATCC 30864]|uniref:Alpha-galactosidase n=1 Tax=Capsaspora owczarzaki (strain ATCC 30864) TaxID=595528 RepID=A0A0D2VVR9_CAPO3|nr:alpha-galactosidase [Capsaspora owczarzaki ATCC 30864]KJE95576.1 alpha-galactosidase [Capsaspora owczarzaki ATCC 30864]KJE95577.1 alpha-galactosidase, variant [Capsaspora owczarzaki ATCC 30864]|eukprot:XP_004345607.2 alpha-galactosidase [Capsaspora owczarzaki ATCC 30864]
MKVFQISAVVAALLVASSVGLDNGLGRTPQMGFNTWNHFGCNISEALIRSTVDVMVATGLSAVGYKYINLDDCWAVNRTAAGVIVADPVAFPSGIAALASYVHSKGMLFGLYSDAGTKTCAGRPGSVGYEKIDAQTYAAWGVDYLKYDNCNAPADQTPQVRYNAMRDALNATGRPIFYSMCDSIDDPSAWAKPVVNSWRTASDISDSWSSIMKIVDKNEPLWKIAGPGGWNDPDVLEVGNGGLSTTEYTSHFTLWALMKAPLIFGCDVTKMTNDTLRILTNTEVIEWNQDSLGIQGHRVKRGLLSEVWMAPLANGRFAVVLFNTDPLLSAHMTVTWAELGLTAGSKYTARDVWQHKNVGLYAGTFDAQVAPKGVVAVTLVPA